MTPQAAVSKEPKKERTARVDQAQLLRRKFALDVFTCDWCGDAHCPAASPWGATWAGVCLMGLHRLSTGTAHSPRGTGQQPSSTPRFPSSPSTGPLSRLYALRSVTRGEETEEPHIVNVDVGAL